MGRFLESCTPVRIIAGRSTMEAVTCHEMQTTRAITSRYGCLHPVLLQKMEGEVPGKRLQEENRIGRTEENLFTL